MNMLSCSLLNHFWTILVFISNPVDVHHNYLYNAKSNFNILSETLYNQILLIYLNNFRLEKVLRQLQSRSGDLTLAERSMKRELSNMEVRLKQHKNSLEQLKMKQSYQNKQLTAQKQAKTKATASTVSLNKTQTESLKETLQLQ